MKGLPRARTTERLPLISVGDVALGGTELAHAILARAVPASSVDTLSRRLAETAVKLRPTKRRRLEARIAAILGPHTSGLSDPHAMYISQVAALLQQRMLYARLGARSDWRPSIEVEGAAAVEAARQAGRGVVFWALPQEITSLLHKLVCHDRGWDLHQLSHWSHGSAVSWLGIRTISRRERHIEEQFCRRLVMRDGDKHGALKQARRVLMQGGTVGFRGIGWSNAPVRYGFFDGGIDLALGAPSLARRTKAALFSVAGHHSDNGFVIRFEPIDADGTRTAQDLGAEFVARLEEAVVRAPSLWNANLRQWSPQAPD